MSLFIVHERALCFLSQAFLLLSTTPSLLKYFFSVLSHTPQYCLLKLAVSELLVSAHTCAL